MPSNPLVKGYSAWSISRNIRASLREYRRTGRIGTSRPASVSAAQAQAVAISLSTARRAYRSRHPSGRYPANLRRASNPAWAAEVQRVYGGSSSGGSDPPPNIGSLPRVRRNPTLVCPQCGNTLSSTADPGTYGCACGTEVTVNAK